MGKRISLIGEKFGKLTVIKPTKLIQSRIRMHKNGSFYKEQLQEYSCLCDCGNYKLVTCRLLRGNRHGKGTSSCGCAQRRGLDGNDWSVSFNMLWKNYVCHSNTHKRTFELTKKEFNSFIHQKCHYCNSEPKTIIKSKSKRKPSTTIYNGIDRVNNKLGYIMSNCVTCCEICNKMKLKLTHNEFLTHIGKIYMFNI